MNKMKKRITLLVLVLALVVLLCSACNQSETDYLAELDQNSATYVQDYNAMSATVFAENTYRYTATIYTENLSNFDYENREMPTDKLDESQEERKKWAKTNVTYSFTRVGADCYVEMTVQEPVLDESGFPTFSDEKFKKPVYQEDTVMQLWSYSNGNVLLKVDGTTVYEGEKGGLSFAALEGAHRVLKYASDEFDLLSAYVGSPSTEGLFSVEQRKWFGKKILASQNYLVSNLAGNTESFRSSALASGYKEDLSFDWSRVSTVSTNTVCLTTKKNKLISFEYYNEIIGAYQKTATQIWNGETVTSWYGDRVFAEKSVFEIEYPSSKIAVEIPSV